MNYEELYQQAKEAGEVHDLTPKFIEKWKKDQRVVGKLLGIIEVKSKVGPGTYNQYLMDTDDGLIKFAMGGAADKEYGYRLHEGGIFAITFKAKESIGAGRTLNRFEVAILRSAQAVGDTDDIPF